MKAVPYLTKMQKYQLKELKHGYIGDFIRSLFWMLSSILFSTGLFGDCLNEILIFTVIPFIWYVNTIWEKYYRHWLKMRTYFYQNNGCRFLHRFPREILRAEVFH